MADFGKDVLKIFELATRMGGRIAELEAEVGELRGCLDLAGGAIAPSTKKILASAKRVASKIVNVGPVQAGSKVSVVASKRVGAINARHITTSSNYFGVSYHKASGKWRAQVSRKGLRFNKAFDTELATAIFVQEKLGNTGEADRIRGILAGKAKSEPRMDTNGHELKKQRPGARPGAVRVRYKTTNKYFGVHAIKKTGNFNARVDRKGFRRNLGTFAIAEEAALVVQEYLGNKAECRRLRKILDEKTGSAVDKRHEKEAADGIEEIKGRFVWRWECRGCGETYGGADPEKCAKCQGRAFERIRVLAEPEVELARPEGRHGPGFKS